MFAVIALLVSPVIFAVLFLVFGILGFVLRVGGGRGEKYAPTLEWMAWGSLILMVAIIVFDVVFFWNG
jgi:hypothetical protein